MKKFIFTIIALLGIMMPNTTWAEDSSYREAYAVLVMSSGEDTGKSDAYLTLYYDDKKSEHNEGVVVDLDKMTESPEIMQSRQYLHSVIFDQSFADCRPTSTKYWFANGHIHLQLPWHSISHFVVSSQCNQQHVCFFVERRHFCSFLVPVEHNIIL